MPLVSGSFSAVDLRMTTNDVQVLAECEKRGHEQVVFFHKPSVGLKAIVSIHNTVLGPALGGCRMKLYESESEAIDDVMRLSEGMTYKSAIAGMDLGGGKACIIADPTMDVGRDELFKAFGACINELNGRYFTAEDMGTTVKDMMAVRAVTEFVTGKSTEAGGAGDPSPWTAYGTFAAIKAACEFRFGSSDLTGKKVAVQGVGSVGSCLVEHLVTAGASVVVSDVSESALEAVAKEFAVQVVDNDAIYDAAVDVYAPCAVGQTINENTIPRLGCSIIAGAANNQLIDASVYVPLQERDIMYCPDFLINSGGVISVGAELNPGGWSESWVKEKVARIHDNTLLVLEAAKEENRFTELVALDLAKKRIAAAAQAR